MNRLRLLREGKGLKQKDVAKLISKTVQAYSLYELNKRNIDNDALKTLSEFYGVSVGFILGTETQPQPSKFELQMFSNNAKVAELSGEILSLKDDKKIALTVDILNRIKTMSTDQIEALNLFLSKVK